jgi:hypothetical protein
LQPSRKVVEYAFKGELPMPVYKVHELIKRVMPNFEIELSEAAADVFMRRLHESARRPEHARLFKKFIETRRKDAEFDSRPTRRGLRLARLERQAEIGPSSDVTDADFDSLTAAIGELADAIARLDELTSLLVDVVLASKGVLNILQDDNNARQK